MSALKKVKKLIDELPAGEPFSISLFRQEATADNLRHVLSRLVKSGVIVRVARGVYVKPIQISSKLSGLRSAREIAETITRSTGETLVIHGAEAARQLQLSTQVPMRLVFYANGNSRIIQLGNRTVTLKHVNPSKLIAAGTTAGTVLSALTYLGKENVTTKVIEKITKQLTQNDFNEVLSHIESMPAWMAEVFYHYRTEKKND